MGIILENIGICNICKGKIVKKSETLTKENGRTVKIVGNYYCNSCGIKYEFVPEKQKEELAIIIKEENVEKI